MRTGDPEMIKTVLRIKFFIINKIIKDFLNASKLSHKYIVKVKKQYKI